jgi:dolichol-phosphate mannosyltransferase
MAVILLSTGLILMSIGIAGIYIGKIFEQVKGRPLYFIETRVNFPEK